MSKEVIPLDITVLYKKAEWYMYNYHEIKSEVEEKRNEMQRSQHTMHDGLKDPTGKKALVNITPIKAITIYVHSNGQKNKRITIAYPERIVEAVESTLVKVSSLMRALVEAKYTYKRPWEQTVAKEHISKDLYYNTIREFLFLLLLHLVEFNVLKISNKTI